MFDKIKDLFKKKEVLVDTSLEDKVKELEDRLVKAELKAGLRDTPTVVHNKVNGV